MQIAERMVLSFSRNKEEIVPNRVKGIKEPTKKGMAAAL